MTADVSTARVNDTVTLTAVPAEGYAVDHFTVTDSNGEKVPVSGENWLAGNSITFTMPYAGVEVSAEFIRKEDRSLLIPAEGTQTVVIPEGTDEFRVYDNGGKDAAYAANSNGELVLMAPEGYIFEITGTVDSQYKTDYLKIYDTDNNISEAALTISGNADNAAANIGSFLTTDNKVCLGFYSNDETNKDGVDLRIRMIDTSLQYAVNLTENEHGTIVSDVEEAALRQVVTLTAAPAEGSFLKEIVVTSYSVHIKFRNTEIPISKNW